MNNQIIIQNLAEDYLGNVDIDQKYQFPPEKWQEIFQSYINFPSVKSPSGSFYVCNEFVVSNLMSEFKTLVERVEHLLPHNYFNYVKPASSYLEFLNYKLVGSKYEELEFDDTQMKKNIEHALEFISNADITKENLTELFKIVSKGNIDFHPVQGSSMFRAIDLAVYNQYDRLLFTCVDFQQIDQHISDLMELCNLNNRRDEYANFLLTHVIKAHFLRVSPFYRYNESLAELIVVWFLNRQEFKLNYLAHHNLFELNHQMYNRGLEEMRFSYNGRDLTYFIKDQIKMINIHLEAYDYIKVASDFSVGELDMLTARERDYVMIVLCSHLRDQFFNWEMINDELKRSNIATTKAGVLKILNRLVAKELLVAKVVGKSKLFKINL